MVTIKNTVLKFLRSKVLRNTLFTVVIIGSILSPVLPSANIAYAANGDTYYWVGVNNGSGNWTDPLCWASSTGGVGGAFVTAPNSTNNVKFDGGSFNATGATVIVDATAYCLSMDWTGATNTPTLTKLGNFEIRAYGDITFIPDMILAASASSLYYIAIYGNCQLTSAGLTIPRDGIYIGNNSSFTLADNYTGGAIRLDYGSLNTNDKTVTLVTGANNVGLSFGGALAKSVSFGSSTINSYNVNYFGSALTVNANTATINVSGTGSVALGSANWNGASFNLTGTAHTVSGSPTGIGNFNLKSDATQTITFTAGGNVRATTVNLTGDATHTHTIKSSISGNMSQITGTTIDYNYCTVTDMVLADINDDVLITCAGATGGTFATENNIFDDITIQGAGNYPTTLTGNSTADTWYVDASSAAKTIIATGTSQLVDDFTRDTGTNVITLTNGTWSKSDTTPLWLDYLTVSGSTANTTGVWFAGQHSTDGGGNTAWIFDDPAITVETISATGITMDKDGVTGGTLTGNVTTLLDGTPRIVVHAETGLTAAYGVNTTGGTIYDNGLFTVSVPVNQTPGETYHYRMVGETGNDTSPFNGADGTYTYTMPTVTTGTGVFPGGNLVTLPGTVGSMGVATTAYYFTQYGTTSGSYTNTASDTINVAATYTDVVTAPGSDMTLFFRPAVQVGATIVYGTESSVHIPSAAASNMLKVLLRVFLAMAIMITCLLVGVRAGGTTLLTVAIIGLVAFIIIDNMIQNLF